MQAIPDIIGRQLHAARQQVAELAVVAQRIGKTGPETVDVRTTLRGRNQVDVGLVDRGTIRIGPGNRPLGLFALPLEHRAEWLGRQQGRTGQALDQVLFKTVGVVPFVFLLRLLDLEADMQAGTQHRLGPQRVPQLVDRELVGVEELRIRPETQRRAGIGLADGADLLELAGPLAATEAHVVLAAVAADPDFEVFRQRVDHRHADTVQATGILVVVAGKFSARMQPGEDQFDAGNLLDRVLVHGHAAAVIGDLQRTVGKQGDVDALAVAGDGLVDTVVDDLVGEMIRPAGVGVHAGTATHRVETAQDLDVGSFVTGTHGRPGLQAADCQCIGAAGESITAESLNIQGRAQQRAES